MTSGRVAGPGHPSRTLFTVGVNLRDPRGFLDLDGPAPRQDALAGGVLSAASRRVSEPTPPAAVPTRRAWVTGAGGRASFPSGSSVEQPDPVSRRGSLTATESRQ